MRWYCGCASLLLLTAVYGQQNVGQQASVSLPPGDTTQPIAPVDPAVSNVDLSGNTPSTTGGGQQTTISPMQDEGRPMPGGAGMSPMPGGTAGGVGGVAGGGGGAAMSPGAMDIAVDQPQGTMGQGNMGMPGMSPALGGAQGSGALPGSMGAGGAAGAGARGAAGGAGGLNGSGAATGNRSTSSTGFSCYVNAGRQASGQNGAIPRPANFTSGVTFCYRAQRPNGTCIDATCSNTNRVWNYGVTDRNGCNSMKESETQGVYKNVFCCSTEQCNAPDPSLDPDTVILDNNNMSGNMDAGITMNDTVTASSAEDEVANTSSANTRATGAGASSTSTFDISPSPSLSSNRTTSTLQSRSSAEVAGASTMLFTAVVLSVTALLVAS